MDATTIKTAPEGGYDGERAIELLRDEETGKFTVVTYRTPRGAKSDAPIPMMPSDQPSDGGWFSGWSRVGWYSESFARRVFRDLTN